MNTKNYFKLGFMVLASISSSSAEVHYVDANSTNAAPPYISWATAATSIQDAVDAAAAGDEVVVTNGSYGTGWRDFTRVIVDKPVSVRSVNGPEVTIINGGQASRCVFLTTGATLSGFTLTNGYSIVAAGVFCSSLDAVVSNCVISGNSAEAGTRPTAYGGGAEGGTLNHCRLSGNSATCEGGGADACTLNNCTLTSNSADAGGGASRCTLNNCTLTGNSGGGAFGCTMINCIAYFNAGENYDSASRLNYSCTTPLPTNGLGNITNEPAFLNPEAGNFHLGPDSPCIDAGTNLSPIITNDLDGRPRPLDGNGDGVAGFDIGAYEYRALLVWQGSPNPNPPHADWATAAHTIQDAVDSAIAGDEIVVTNGLYVTGGRSVDNLTTNRVAVDKSLTLRSVNGPQFTAIDGGGSNRCVYLTSGATLSGLTLTNGRAAGGGGGLFCESTDVVVSNCVVSGNLSFVQYAFLFNPPCCERIDYGASAGGVYGGTLNNCILDNNVAETSWSYGPICDITSCSAVHDGQFAAYEIPGLGGGARNAILNQCILKSNSAGYGGGAYGCTLNNCTVVLNSATSLSPFAFDYGGGTYECSAHNCVVYFNMAVRGTNYDSSSTINYSCTTPLPTNGVDGNISSDPLFVNAANGDFHLQPNSPCINAGENAYVTASADLDGNPRIAGGTVDIGAYEFQLPASRISYAWLQQYGLTATAGVDDADPDGDGLNNWQEWRCGTDPTNALSALRLLTPVSIGTNVSLTWQSVASVSYFLERCTNLTASAIFTSLATNILGQPGTTSYTDTNPVSSGPFFYRVGVGTP